MNSELVELPGGIAFTIPLSIMILVAMVVVHEFGHFITAKLSGVQVLEFGIGWPPRLFGRTWRGTLYSLNAVPVGAFVRMLGENEQADSPESFSAKPRLNRALILVAGSAMNFLLAPFLFGTASLINDFQSVEITAVVAGSPADAAGLLPGDRIEAVGETTVEIPSDLGKVVRNAQGMEIQLAVDRNGDKRLVDLVPRLAHPDDEGPMGVSIRSYFAPAPLPKALARSLTRTVEAIRILPQLIKAIALLPKYAVDLVSGGPPSESVTGPVGIVNAVGEAAQRGPAVVLMLAGFITVQLGLLNLLPIPGLDGGRLVFLGLEALRRGRRLPSTVEGTINFIGIMFLLVLIAFVTVGDVRRIAGG